MASSAGVEKVLQTYDLLPIVQNEFTKYRQKYPDSDRQQKGFI